MDILRDAAFATWYQIGTQYESLVPQYVREASPLTEKSAAVLDSGLFADQFDRAFSIDSPAATWLSAAYFAKNADTAYAAHPFTKDMVAAEIKRAAAIFGITKDVDAITAAIKDGLVVKTASDDNDPDNWGWPERRKYPLFNVGDIKQASDYFMKNKHLYAADDRRKVASKIVKRATALGTTAPDALLKYAGIGYPRLDTLSAEILVRMKEAEYRNSSPELVIVLGDMIEKVAMHADRLTPERLTEIVGILDSVDRLHDPDGLRAKNAEFLDPEEAAFGITPAEAEKFAADSVSLGGFVFSASELATTDSDIFRSVLGDDFMDKVANADGKGMSATKLGKELSQLTQSDGKALVSALRSTYGDVSND